MVKRGETLITDIQGDMEKEDYQKALSKLSQLKALKSEVNPRWLKEAFRRRIDKIEANLLLGSDLGSTNDFKRLIRDGTLDASPTSGEQKDHISPVMCARVITAHAVTALSSSGIKCLDVRSNPHLVKIPAEELCKITSLKQLLCTGCSLLESPPPEVAEHGGEQAMSFLRDCLENGGVNESLTIFLTGDGEVGKTSVARALMNELGNSAPPIDKDTRTVGIDLYDWTTTDRLGQALTFKIKDVGGQRVYMKIHEFFLVIRAVFLFVWRADSSMEGMRDGVTRWLNLIQACTPGVAVLPVATHTDCVSASDLEQNLAIVKEAFEGWQTK